MAEKKQKNWVQPPQQQARPGLTDAMRPRPDHGEESYKGAGRLAGKRALITGGDSGIGRAVAIAFAREGADILISYLSEDEDAAETKRWVEQAGRKAVVMAGDIQDSAHCRALVDRAVTDLGGLDILVTMPPTRPPSRRWRRSPTRNGNSRSARTSMPCSGSRVRPSRT